MTVPRIRYYECNLADDGVHLDVTIGLDTKVYPRPPSLAELNELLGTDFTSITAGYSFYPPFYNKDEMVASPRLPDDGIGYMYDGFVKDAAMKIPPKLQNVQDFSYVLEKSGIAIPPVIPKTATRLLRAFCQATALRTPASIPKSVTSIQRIYDGCTSLSGEMIVRPSSLGYLSYALRNTVGSITLYGNQTLCQQIAATANNGNAAWSAWYSPVPAVTNRGPNSYTTAADMTRMVRNGALAVDTYAPGRMVYQQGDIVREDEWIALVEAAQTIDPTVTMSTHYSNLNKIEAAFDSAL